MPLKKCLVNDMPALRRIDLQRPSRLRRWDTPPGSMSLVVSRRFRPSDVKYNESCLVQARRRLVALQRILQERLTTTLDEETRRRIHAALELSTQQLRDQDCDQARTEKLLEHYRDIRDRLQTVVKTVKPQFGIEVELALHLAKAMNVASFDVCGHGREARALLITLCIHAEDLRLFVYLTCMGESLISPCYRRDSRVTGYFEPDKLFAHL